MTSTAIEIQLRQQAMRPRLEAISEALSGWQAVVIARCFSVIAAEQRRRRKRLWQQRRRPGARFSTFQPTIVRVAR